MSSRNLLSAFLSIHNAKPITIQTPTTTQENQTTPTSTRRQLNSNRRAAVAIIIRITPNSQLSPKSTSPNSPSPLHPSSPNSNLNQSSSDHTNQIHQFVSQPWVQEGSLEIFFIERANRTSDRWSAHLAFPGGRMEPDDEDGLFCAMRETWEEVGIDLAESDFIHLGRLDDREITTSLGKRLLMVLSPYVFLCTRSDGGPIPTLESNDVTAVYWVPLHSLAGPHTKWGEMTIDLSSRLAPSRGPLLRFILRSLVGSMRFRSIILPHNPITQIPRSNTPPPDLNLWGLTLGMTLDLLSFFRSEDNTSPNIPTSPKTPDKLLFRSPSLDHLNAPPIEITLVSPSITSIFPRFTHPDINALIWLLGRRYRKLIKQSQQQQQQEDNKNTNRMKYLNNQYKKMTWTSLTMKEFYRSVRKALILSILFRISCFFASFNFFLFVWPAPKISSFFFKRTLFNLNSINRTTTSTFNRQRFFAYPFTYLSSFFSKQKK